MDKITWAEQKWIEERLAEKVEGALEYDRSDDQLAIAGRGDYLHDWIKSLVMRIVTKISSSESESDGASESKSYDSDDSKVEELKGFGRQINRVERR